MAEPKTCGTCAYLGESYGHGFDENEDEIPSGYMICNLLRHMNNNGFQEPLEPDLPPAGVIDGSGYWAAFCVKEEFGCNQWEPLCIVPEKEKGFTLVELVIVMFFTCALGYIAITGKQEALQRSAFIEKCTETAPYRDCASRWERAHP